MSGWESFKNLVDDQRLALKIYAVGAVLFFVGLGFIIFADKSIPPSIQQEAIAFVGTAVGGIGFITAMSAQVLLIIGRFKNMGQRP